jgi:hypothetical protein
MPCQCRRDLSVTLMTVTTLFGTLVAARIALRRSIT